MTKHKVCRWHDMRFIQKRVFFATPVCVHVAIVCLLSIVYIHYTYIFWLQFLTICLFGLCFQRRSKLLVGFRFFYRPIFTVLPCKSLDFDRDDDTFGLSLSVFYIIRCVHYKYKYIRVSTIHIQLSNESEYLKNSKSNNTWVMNR